MDETTGSEPQPTHRLSRRQVLTGLGVAGGLALAGTVGRSLLQEPTPEKTSETDKYKELFERTSGVGSDGEQVIISTKVRYTDSGVGKDTNYTIVTRQGAVAAGGKDARFVSAKEIDDLQTSKKVTMSETNADRYKKVEIGNDVLLLDLQNGETMLLEKSGDDLYRVALNTSATVYPQSEERIGLPIVVANTGAQDTALVDQLKANRVIEGGQDLKSFEGREMEFQAVLVNDAVEQTPKEFTDGTKMRQYFEFGVVMKVSGKNVLFNDVPDNFDVSDFRTGDKVIFKNIEPQLIKPASEVNEKYDMVRVTQ